MTTYNQGTLSNEEFRLKKIIASVGTYSKIDYSYIMTGAQLESIWNRISLSLQYPFDLIANKDMKTISVWTEKDTVCIEAIESTTEFDADINLIEAEATAHTNTVKTFFSITR